MIINKGDVMNSRNTRQKQIIINTLVKDKSHPTISELYKNVSKKDPLLGQATVYRNINRLVEEGKVKKIPTIKHGDRYDADCSEHSHFICTSCGKIQDIYDVSLSRYLKQIEMMYPVQIDSCQVLFEGTCHDCIKLARGEYEEV